MMAISPQPINHRRWMEMPVLPNVRLALEAALLAKSHFDKGGPPLI